MMSKSLSNLLAKMPAPALEAAKRRKEELLRQRPFAFIRSSLGLMQARVAELLGVSQVAVSKLEARDDFLLSTLAAFTKATGGQLKVQLEYPGRSFSIVEGDTGSRRKARFRVEDVASDIPYETVGLGWTSVARVSVRTPAARFVDIAANDLSYGYACGVA